MMDLRELSERERWEYLFAMLREGKGPRAGRPKKNSDIPKWRDLGLTRKEVWRMRRLGEIPDADFEAFLAWRTASGKSPSYRSILIHFGKINVPTENDFDGTPVGDLAKAVLKPVERIVFKGDLDRGQRRVLKRALQTQLQQIFRDPNPAYERGCR
jgi:hypothetical protein